MCGIVGFSTASSNDLKESLRKALVELQKRGPDSSGQYFDRNTGLGHTRLSILDTSDLGNQPMHDQSGRYTLVFNGEIYNYKQLKKDVANFHYRSNTDSEVLLYLLISQGSSCLHKLNGFFAFAFYDRAEGSLLIARDQMGIKPLHYFQSSNLFLFASEMKALLSFPIPRTIDHQSLHWYLQLNYLPGDLSILQGVQKLTPGHYLQFSHGKLSKHSYLPEETIQNKNDSYQSAQDQLADLLEASVQKRLISDVPLGSFLSGGTDSSIIASLAARHHPNLNTFSIGYKDHPFFDETAFAELVARKAGTHHTTFKLSNDDLLEELENVVSYLDEPFADSSAIPTYILSKKTRKHVTVALSGDGADELFAGYYKHLALAKSLESSFTNGLLGIAGTLVQGLPQSRSGTVSNLIRRLTKYSETLKLSKEERYWRLASLTPDPSCFMKQEVAPNQLQLFKEFYLPQVNSLQDYLQTDQKIVLTGDMLTKVDLMSMANSLEVRVPFLDKNVVDFANKLPLSFKIKGNDRKRILQDAFKDLLPIELYHRPKKGFEVPLLQWMQKELLAELDQVLFDTDHLEQQALFEVKNVMNLRQTMLSRNPGDVHGIVWALYVFQKWYRRYLR
ncbi:MAG: asparagine synthase (glutamine-hydrolyzing) [Bacteroidota bacterium]